MSTLIQRFVRNLFSTLDIKIENFVEDEIIKEYLLKGDYNSIILTRHLLAKEKSTQYFRKYESKGEYKVEMNIIPKNGAVIPLITKKVIASNLENKTGFFSNKEFKDIGFDEDTNIKVVSTYNGNTRTIDLEDVFKMRPYYSINVSINAKGFSDFDSIKKEAIKLIRELNLNII